MLKALKYFAGFMVLYIFFGSLILGYIDGRPVDRPKEVIQDIRFGADKDTLVYRYCPNFGGKACRLALFNIASGKAYQFEAPNEPFYARWPAVSRDGKKVVITRLTSKGSRLILIDLVKKDFQFLTSDTRGWVKAAFSEDGRSVYANAKLKANEWGTPDDIRRQENWQMYGIFEVKLDDLSVRRVSDKAFLNTVKFETVEGRIYQRGVELGEEGSVKDVVWSLNVGGGEKDIISSEIALRLSSTSINKDLKKNYSEDVYFNGISDNRSILFEAVNESFGTCCGYNLYVFDSDKNVQQLTFTYDYYGPSADISRDGERVIYQRLKHPNRNYYRVLLPFLFADEGVAAKEDLGFHIVDIESKKISSRKLNLPEKFEEYSPVLIRPDG